MVKQWILQCLTRSERLTLILCYYEQMSMKEIGATSDISESRVSQIHKEFLSRLKAKAGRDKIEAVLRL